MSCWADGMATTRIAQAGTGAPVVGGAPIAHPQKCGVCGCFTTRARRCVNPDCGPRAQTLKGAGAWPQPLPAGAGMWQAGLVEVTRNGRPTSVMLDAEAAAYLRRVGLPPSTVVSALATVEPQVWMYVSRCRCGAFMKRQTGRCNNPRCSKSQANALVVQPGPAWTWPPDYVSATHLQRALGGSAGAPDAHIAWHLRVDDWVAHATIATGSAGRHLLRAQVECFDSLRAVMRDGLRGGWLDSTSPAFDADAHRALVEASAALHRVEPGTTAAYAALRGEWTVLAGPRNVQSDALNPLSSTRAESMDQARTVQDAARSGDEQAQQHWAFGMVMAARFALEFDTPALPPAVTPEVTALYGRIIEQLHRWNPWLEQPEDPDSQPQPLGSQTTLKNEAYWWLFKARCQPRHTLHSEQLVRAAYALRSSSAELGYGSLTQEEARLVLTNGFSPAQWRATQRAFLPERQAVAAAVAQARTPGDAFEAGRRLASAAAQLRASHAMVYGQGGDRGDPNRLWPGGIDISGLSPEATRAFVAGAGLGALSYFPDDEVTRWAELAGSGYLFRGGPGGTAMGSVSGRLEQELRRQGLLPAGAAAIDIRFDRVRVGGGGAGAQWYRVDVAPGGSGDLETTFAPVQP